MKKYVLPVLLIVAFAFSLKAQENKKVHLKVIKNDNGNITEIDTVFDTSDQEGIFYYGKDFISDINVDSILKELKISEIDGKKIISLTDEVELTEGEDISWITSSADLKGDSIIFKKFISNEKDGKGCKHKLIWLTDSTDDIHTSDSNHVFIIKSKDQTIELLKEIEALEGDLLKEEFIVKGDDNDHKVIKIYLSDDETKSDVKIETTDGENIIVGENANIYRYETDDGKIIFKTVISDDKVVEVDEKSEQEEKDDNELVLEDFKLYPNPTDGIFNIEFKLDNKETVTVKVFNKDGKSVFNDKIRKFDGYYVNEINLSEQDNGIYFVKVIQGNKSITKKVLKD